jgi:hypothetical protein
MVRLQKGDSKLWAIALERYGMPALIGKSTDTSQMMDMLSQLYSNAYAAVLPDDEISILEKPNGTGLGDSYERAISFCNKMMYRSLFLPSLLEGGESGGSYALGKFTGICSMTPVYGWRRNWLNPNWRISGVL